MSTEVDQYASDPFNKQEGRILGLNENAEQEEGLQKD